MTTTASETTPERAPGTVPALVLPLDLALIRWAVVCQSWADLAAGSAPLLSAFLAGWCCRCIGASQPADLGQFRDSFRVGWREADQQVEIEARQNAPRQTAERSGASLHTDVGHESTMHRVAEMADAPRPQAPASGQPEHGGEAAGSSPAPVPKRRVRLPCPPERTHESTDTQSGGQG